MSIAEAEILRPDQFNGDFRTDFLSVDQLSLTDLETIHQEADAMEWLARTRGVDTMLQGHVYDLVFWDSKSTRTKYSFEHAIKRLGGQAVIFDQGASSSGKGETFEDTIEMIDAYLVPERDGIIVRHNQAGNVARAAEIADAPVINAGDGKEEHPTQGVLDTKTIQNIFPANNIHEARIGFFGDLAHARTANSSAPLLAMMGVRQMTFVAPDERLRMSPAILDHLRQVGVEVHETDDLREVSPNLDIIYGLRTQYELMHPDDEKLQEEARREFSGKCIITPEKVEHSTAKWMHPLPQDERDLNLAPELRSDSRCIYKEQARNGQWTRMAWLARMAGKSLIHEYQALQLRDEVSSRHLHLTAVQ